MKFILVIVLSFFFMNSFSNISEDGLEKANSLIEESKYNQAIKLLENELKNDSLNAETYFLLGNCYYYIDSFDNAISSYYNVLNIDSESVSTLFNLGNLYDILDQKDSAKLYFEKFIKVDPEDEYGYFRLGIINKSFNNEHSLQLFEKAYSIDSSNLTFLYYLTNENYLKGNYEKSIQLAEIGKIIDTSSADFFLLDAESQLKLGNYKKAIEQSDSALLINPRLIAAYFLKAKAKIYQKTNTEIVFKDSNNDLKFKEYKSVDVDKNLSGVSIEDYNSLKEKILSGEELTLDQYFKFYLSQVKHESFQPYFGSSNEQIIESYKNEDFETLAKLNEEIFGPVPVKIKDFYKVAIANFIIKDLKSFETLITSYVGLLESIIATGTGKEFESAFIVVSVGNEYEILDYLDLYSSMQSLNSHNGQSFDILSAKDEYGARKDIYFNIDIPFTHLGNSFGTKSDKKKKREKRKRN